MKYKWNATLNLFQFLSFTYFLIFFWDLICFCRCIKLKLIVYAPKNSKTPSNKTKFTKFTKSKIKFLVENVERILEAKAFPPQFLLFEAASEAYRSFAGCIILSANIHSIQRNARWWDYVFQVILSDSKMIFVGELIQINFFPTC